MKESKYAGTQTEKNLMAAFAGESEARNKYTYCFMAETEDVLQKRELLGGRDDAKTIAQQLAEGRAQAARENAARPTPAKGKEARDDR